MYIAYSAIAMPLHCQLLFFKKVNIEEEEEIYFSKQ